MSITINNQFINALPGFIFYKDLDSHYLGCNEAMATLVGLDHCQNILGRTDFDLFENAELASKYREDDRLVLHKESITVIEETTGSNGQQLQVLTTKSIIKSENNDPEGMLAQAFILSGTILNTLNNFSSEDKKQLPAHNESNRYDLCECFPMLTVRESEVLFYFIRGYSANDIAKLFKRSIRTIEKHMEHIKTKLKCNNKKELIEKTFEIGFQQIFIKSIGNF